MSDGTLMARIGGAGLPLLLSAAQLVAALVVLGRPDPARAAAFFTTSLPDMEQAAAGAQLLLWVVVGCTFALALSMTAGSTLSAFAGRRRWVWAAGVLAVGLLLLAAGAGHRLAATSPSMGGGSLQEAREQIGG